MTETRDAGRTLIVLLPSLRISGGVQETLRLAAGLAQRGVTVRVLALWKHPHESPVADLSVDYLSTFIPSKVHAFYHLPYLLFGFLRWTAQLCRRSPHLKPAILLTHFSTFPFAWLRPDLVRFCFNQDIEWMFVPAGPIRTFVRWMILSVSRRSRVIVTNDFIAEKYLAEGIQPFAQASLWPSSFWVSGQAHRESVQRRSRPIDIAMLLRHGVVKRPDLYWQLLDELRSRSELQCVVVTPESDLYAEAKSRVGEAWLRPDNEELREVYSRSKVFVLLSDTEGFGLPPLEAMASGCVPMCRDSGGVRCYMRGPLSAYVVPKSENMHAVATRLIHLLSDGELGSLSEHCRQAFLEGLSASESECSQAYDRVAAILQTATS